MLSIKHLCVLVLIKAIISADKNCEDIIPKSSSDCVLSSSDQAKYKYCCYEDILGVKECAPYDEEGYQEQKKYMEIFSNQVNDFICGNESENESNYINLSIIFFIILIILNI